MSALLLTSCCCPLPLLPAAELLTLASRQAMADMVHDIFSGLEAIPEPVISPYASLAHGTPRLQVSPPPSTILTSAMPTLEEGVGPAEASAGESGGEEGGQQEQQQAAAGAAEAGAQQEGAEGAAGAAAAGGPGSSPAADSPAAGAQPQAANGSSKPLPTGSADLEKTTSPFAEAAADAEDGAAGQAPAAGAAADAAEVLTAGTPTAAAASAAAAAGGAPGARAPSYAGEIVSLLPHIQPHATEVEGYGIEAVREVLLFIISLIGTSPVGVHQDLPAHGLELMNVSLQAAGPSLGHHDSLLDLLRQDLVPAMFVAARQPRLACLAGVCQVALALYLQLGPYLLLQVRSWSGRVVVWEAWGRGGGQVVRALTGSWGPTRCCRVGGWGRGGGLGPFTVLL